LAGQNDDNKVYLPFMQHALTPIIPETTVVLTEDTTQYLESVSPDGSVYTFSQMTARTDRFTGWLVTEEKVALEDLRSLLAVEPIQ
jgi:hypothetical protein